jgi:hypothetical protein
LEGKHKDVLLLDIFPWQLGVLAKNCRLAPGSNKKALDILEISTSEDENLQFYDLSNYKNGYGGWDRTIPMRHSILVVFNDTNIDVGKLVFVDRDRQSNIDERIATLHVNLHAKPYRDWHITLDIDANAVAQIDVRPAGTADDVSTFRFGPEHKAISEKATPVWMTFP